MTKKGLEHALDQKVRELETALDVAKQEINDLRKRSSENLARARRAEARLLEAGRVIGALSERES